MPVTHGEFFLNFLLGSDRFILASDDDRAADDPPLATKLIAANPILDREKAPAGAERRALGAAFFVPVG